jgi:hypothetical protein
MRVADYDISRDGQQIVMEVADAQGMNRFWTARLDRPSPPQQVPGVDGRQPRFGPSGEIFFRSSGLVYRVQQDGRGLRQALPQQVLWLSGLSPDGRWLIAWSPLPDNNGMATQALPLAGGRAVRIANNVEWNWSPDGRALAMTDGPIAPDRTYMMPLAAGEAMPALPPGGLLTEAQIAGLPGIRRIDALIVPGTSPGVYAFYRGTTQRNLYRIPLP